MKRFRGPESRPARLLVCAIGIAFAAYAIMISWAFHIGGRWTPAAWWGVGMLRDSAGARYGLYVYFYPWARDTTRLLGKNAWPPHGLRGQAWACTAGGAKYRFNVGGQIYGAWLDTDGRETDLSLGEPRGPKIRRAFRLSGVWHGPELVLDDQKTMFMNFRPDGTLTPTGRYTSPVPEKHAAVTLAWGSYSDFESLCQSLRATPAERSAAAQ